MQEIKYKGQIQEGTEKNERSEKKEKRNENGIGRKRDRIRQYIEKEEEL